MKWSGEWAIKAGESLTHHGEANIMESTMKHQAEPPGTTPSSFEGFGFFVSQVGRELCWSSLA